MGLLLRTIQKEKSRVDYMLDALPKGVIVSKAAEMLSTSELYKGLEEEGAKL